MDASLLTNLLLSCRVSTKAGMALGSFIAPNNVAACNLILFFLLDNASINDSEEIVEVFKNAFQSLDLDLVDSIKKFQMYRAELVDSKGQIRNNFSCDEDFILRMCFNVAERIPGIYGYLHFQRSDGIITWVTDSNDVENNKLEQLPLGKSTVEIHIPHRFLGPGKYTIYLNYTSNQNINGWNVDSPFNCLQVRISDDRTRRGDSRGGFLSTILSWNIKNYAI